MLSSPNKAGLCALEVKRLANPAAISGLCGFAEPHSVSHLYDVGDLSGLGCHKGSISQDGLGKTEQMMGSVYVKGKCGRNCVELEFPRRKLNRKPKAIIYNFSKSLKPE